MNHIENVKECTSAEMHRVIEEIKKANEQMEFFSRKVYPYNFPITVEKMVKDAEDFDRCTRMSKGVLYEEIKGLVEIINAWIDHYNQPKVNVRYLQGKKAGMIAKMAQDMAELFSEAGMVEILKGA